MKTIYMKSVYKYIINTVLSIVFIIGCKNSEDIKNNNEKDLSIGYEKITLDNGLDVILHEDKSDPIVAVSVLVHVGSNREKPGKTGFAHFFEHMLFQKSENVPEGYFLNKIGAWGGTVNGGTNSDQTIYYEVVPKDALEKILWMESDRMGYFINSITLKDLEGEKPIVKNEKRQNYDNQPYGHTFRAISKALYPENHPYNWSTIGELEDLQNATLDDVREFYNKWYGPNNATLVIAGDINKEQVKKMVDKYFGEIPAKEVIESLKPMPVSLQETKVLMYEDRYAKLPEIRLTFPTVERYHPDSWALDALAEILHTGKRAKLYKSIVEKHQLAPSANASHSSRELAGNFTIRVRANANVNLDSVRNAIFEALQEFEKDGFEDNDLNTIKARQEREFYNGISGVLGKAFQLAIYNEQKNDPGYVTTDINNIMSVTRDDVMEVYRKYIKNKKHIVTNFVPLGEKNLAIINSSPADVIEEVVTPYKANEILEQENDMTITKTPSSLDRSIEPGFGEDPKVTPPEIWTSDLSNGLKVWGIENTEIPLVQFSLRIKGGKYFDDPKRVGVANLMTDIMMEGTLNKSPEELEDAIGVLGSNTNMVTTNNFIAINGNCLARNYQETIDLVTEILLEPRWDEEEFKRIKESTITSIKQRDASFNQVANQVFFRQLYGENHILSHPTSGYAESVEKITINDLKEFYEKYFAADISNFHVVGNISKTEVEKSLSKIEEQWIGKNVKIPSYDLPVALTEPKVVFVDIPDSKVSAIRVGCLTTDDKTTDLTKIQFANNTLGNGPDGRLFLTLREEKGYTYVAYSVLLDQIYDPAAFLAYSSVRSNVTKESLDIFKEILVDYEDSYTEEDLETTRKKLIKQNAGRYETLSDLITVLHDITDFDLPLNYLDTEQSIIESMDLKETKSTINKYLNAQQMLYVVVGDKKTQFERLKVEGQGNPMLVDIYGNEIPQE